MENGTHTGHLKVENVPELRRRKTCDCDMVGVTAEPGLRSCVAEERPLLTGEGDWDPPLVRKVFFLLVSQGQEPFLR